MFPARSILCLALFFVFAGGLLDGLPRQSSSQLVIVAHTKEKDKNIMHASGDVEIHYKHIKVFADYVRVDTETKDIYAQGRVSIHLPEEVITMDEFRGNLDSNEGFLEKVHGMVQPTITYEADSVERRDENFYHLQKAWVSSCAQPVPRWRFTFSKGNFKKDDYLEMWNPVFYIKKVPVFYLPYMRYPLDKERATGFLMPSAGYSGRKGFHYSQAFYWAIRRNMDATLNVDYYGQRGVGGGLEYRYVFPKGLSGQANLFYFRFNEAQTAVYGESNAYIVRFKHNQPLPWDFRLVADVDYQSSFDFLREFDNDFLRAVVSNRSSQVYLSRSWSTFNLNARVSRFETYFKQNDSSIIRINQPEVSLTSSKMKLFSPLYFSFSTELERWEHGWNTDFDKGTQKRSQRLAFSPSVNIPFTAIPWISVSTTAATNFNYYFQSYAPGTSQVVKEPLLTRNYTLSLDVTGPVFYKVFFGAENQPKLKHIIEPIFSYRYNSPISGSDRIITQRFFIRDHYIEYGLVNHFLVKGMDQEILNLRLSQRFYFEPEESPLQNYLVDGRVPEYSDVTANLRFYPSNKYHIDFSAGYNPYEKTFSRLRLGANLGGPADDYFLRVNWFKSIDPFREIALFSRHQLGLFGGGKVPGIPLTLQAELDYNLQEKELLYSVFSVAWTFQCIDFKTDLRVFYFREKPEVQFNFSFGLGNIGKTTDFLGGLGF